MGWSITTRLKHGAFQIPELLLNVTLISNNSNVPLAQTSPFPILWMPTQWHQPKSETVTYPLTSQIFTESLWVLGSGLAIISFPIFANFKGFSTFHPFLRWRFKHGQMYIQYRNTSVDSPTSIYALASLMFLPYWVCTFSMKTSQLPGSDLSKVTQQIGNRTDTKVYSTRALNFLSYTGEPMIMHTKELLKSLSKNSTEMEKVLSQISAQAT